MGWANHAKTALARGERVQIRPHGNSMIPKIYSGDLVTLEPCDPEKLEVGDIVLVRVSGNDYLHLIKARDGERFQIGNNRGKINGWAGKSSVYGRVCSVERRKA